MRQSRRMFLGALGAGITVLSLPEVFPMLQLLNPVGGADEDLADTIHRLLLGESSGGPFVARAEANMFVGRAQPMLSTQTALLKMLDSHGFNRRFRGCVNNDDAAQCKGEFERQEDQWRKRGFAAFTKVHRSAADDQVAFGVGGNIDENSNLVDAAGAVQYEDKAAVPLVKHDPISTLVGMWLHRKDLTAKEIAQALTPIEKNDVTLARGQQATRYETPVSSVVYIPQPRRESGVANAVGVVASNLKREPNKIYLADLFA